MKQTVVINDSNFVLYQNLHYFMEKASKKSRKEGLTVPDGLVVHCGKIMTSELEL